jgi:hypothetical protein
VRPTLAQRSEISPTLASTGPRRRPPHCRARRPFRDFAGQPVDRARLPRDDRDRRLWRCDSAGLARAVVRAVLLSHNFALT